MSDGELLLRGVLNDPADDTARLVYADWCDEQGDHLRAAALRHGVVKRFGIDFDSRGGALTLSPGDVGDHAGGSGWTVTGEVHEDYYEWVNDFEASHPVYGLVWGDFESVVFASSEEAFQHFWQHHEPCAWDYHDI